MNLELSLGIAMLSSSGDSLTGLAIGTVISLVEVVSLWALFVKVGRSGWEILIPIYDVYALADIGCDMPLLWTILAFVPFANVVAYCVIMYKLAMAFDQSVVFAIFLIILPGIGIPLLAFGSAQYGGSYF